MYHSSFPYQVTPFNGLKKVLGHDLLNDIDTSFHGYNCGSKQQPTVIIPQTYLSNSCISSIKSTKPPTLLPAPYFKATEMDLPLQASTRSPSSSSKSLSPRTKNYPIAASSASSSVIGYEKLSEGGQDRFSCKLCIYHTYRKEKILQHLQAHVHGKWVCMHCGKACIKKCDLDRHLIAHRHNRIRSVKPTKGTTDGDTQLVAFGEGNKNSMPIVASVTSISSQDFDDKHDSGACKSSRLSSNCKSNIPVDNRQKSSSSVLMTSSEIADERQLKRKGYDEIKQCDSFALDSSKTTKRKCAESLKRDTESQEFQADESMESSNEDCYIVKYKEGTGDLRIKSEPVDTDFRQTANENSSSVLESSMSTNMDNNQVPNEKYEFLKRYLDKRRTSLDDSAVSEDDEIEEDDGKGYEEFTEQEKAIMARIEKMATKAKLLDEACMNDSIVIEEEQEKDDQSKQIGVIYSTSSPSLNKQGAKYMLDNRKANVALDAKKTSSKLGLALHCNLCSYSTRNSSHMDKHLIAHRSSNKVCNECGKAFERPSDLVRHKERHALKNQQMATLGVPQKLLLSQPGTSDFSPGNKLGLNQGRNRNPTPPLSNDNESAIPQDIDQAGGEILTDGPNKNFSKPLKTYFCDYCNAKFISWTSKKYHEKQCHNNSVARIDGYRNSILFDTSLVTFEAKPNNTIDLTFTDAELQKVVSNSNSFIPGVSQLDDALLIYDQINDCDIPTTTVIYKKVPLSNLESDPEEMNKDETTTTQTSTNSEGDRVALMPAVSKLNATRPPPLQRAPTLKVISSGSHILLRTSESRSSPQNNRQETLEPVPIGHFSNQNQLNDLSDMAEDFQDENDNESKHGILQRILNKMNPPIISKFKCNKCNYGTNMVHKMQEHKKAHSIGFICKLCNKAFIKSSDLTRHWITHSSDEQGYYCDSCDFTSKDRNMVEVHMRTHYYRSPVLKNPVVRKHEFICHGCGINFPNEDAHFKHSKFCQGGRSDHASLMQHACKQCSASFDSLKSLRFHQKKKHGSQASQHESEVPHQCRFCHKKFHDKAKLERHEQLHKAKSRGNSQCPYCKKRFVSKSYLKEHINLHTGEKPYSCSKCGESFSYNQGLVIHRSKGCLPSKLAQTSNSSIHQLNDSEQDEMFPGAKDIDFHKNSSVENSPRSPGSPVIGDLQDVDSSTGIISENLVVEDHISSSLDQEPGQGNGGDMDDAAVQYEKGEENPIPDHDHSNSHSESSSPEKYVDKMQINEDQNFLTSIADDDDAIPEDPVMMDDDT